MGARALAGGLGSGAARALHLQLLHLPLQCLALPLAWDHCFCLPLCFWPVLPNSQERAAIMPTRTLAFSLGYYQGSLSETHASWACWSCEAKHEERAPSWIMEDITTPVF